jgi:hypothetical protein
LSLTNSAFRLLLTWSHSMHGSTVTSVQRQFTVLNFLDRLDIEVKSQVWRAKMSESLWGLIMDFAANLLSSSTPTQTHNFDNRCNGCGRPKRALVRSFSGSPEIWLSNGLNSEIVSELTRIMIFKIVIFLDRLGNLMICTYDLIVLTKTKETIRYCESYAFGGKSALDNHFYRFNARQYTWRRWIKYALNVSTLSCPLMSLAD